MTAMFRLDGRTALVTGGANGLGRMIAEALLQAGARVIITSRRDADAAAREMAAMGNCEGIDADLSTPAGAVALAEAVKARVDALHVLVNNAGKTWGAPLDNYPDQAWDAVMPINVQVPFTLIRDLLPVLEKAGTATDPARILNIGSIAGNSVHRLSAYAYTASKAALHHLTGELASDLARRHIAANIIVPGWFPTDMTARVRADENLTRATTRKIPFGRFGTAAEIGSVAVFLASPAAAYITGAEIPVDGGISGCR
ncbi:MAG: SDR family oxidoreductase [Brevundimonas sp.]|uniref:SDR family oxidoreductase n=1 Tax=Brevundimonas sp. TaxID=1871086 RepID=UPI002487982F|nr:SDR family oxidoreductase [Brevundimonas sp.]MDI1327583.1 SDR family oxidoreductase [Brevundimonas sp.]